MQMDKAGRHQKLNICIILFAGFLFCFMVTMMYIGGSFNLKEFSSAGKVYDFSQKNIQKTVSRWRYSEEEAGFRIRKNNALKKYLLDGRERKWNYLYITVNQLSMPMMSANIVYYRTDNVIIAEQSITLTEGENIITLMDVPMYRMGIRLLNGDGQFISMKSMQLRDDISGIVSGRFEKIFLVSYSGFLLIFCTVMLWKKKNIIRNQKKTGNIQKQGLDLLLYTYHLLIDNVGEKWNSQFNSEKKRFWRRLLFSLLFIWMVFANVSGWTINRELYRYNILICGVILLIIAALAWEKSVIKMNLGGYICSAWLALAVGIIISDLFVDTRAKFVGIALLFFCGILIVSWHSMKDPKLLIYEIMDALEIDFIVAVLYCMVFRIKKLTIQYNGIFRSSDEFSMYAALMLGVFLMHIVWNIKKKNGNFKKYTAYVTGAAISLYFVLRTSVMAGMTAACLILIFAVIKGTQNWKKDPAEKGAIVKQSIYVSIVAFVCVCAVHFSTKYLPEFLHTELEYARETLISNVSPKEMIAFEELKPGLMNGVQSKESLEILMIQKNYVRKLGALGRDDRVNVFGRQVPAYSGYIQMAYRYGIFILLAYIVLQIGMLYQGFKGGIKGDSDVELWLLMITCTFICFCIRGNPETSFGHPLWLVYYLGAGYWLKNKPSIL